MLLVANDVHFDEIGPECRDSHYLRDISAKLLELSRLAASAKAVVCTGDLLHRRVGRNVSHFTVRILIALLKRFPCPFLFIPGNHDIMGQQIKTVIRQPVGVVQEAGVLTRLDEHPFFIPEWDLQLIGIPYTERFERGDLKIQLKKQTKHLVLAMHASLTRESSLRSNITGPDIVLYGHPHIREGCTEQDGICYVGYGSLARITTRPYDQRMVEVAILERKGEKIQIRSRELENQRPWTEIYTKEKTRQMVEVDVEGFANLIEVETIDSISDLDELLRNVSLPVRQRIYFYLAMQ